MHIDLNCDVAEGIGNEADLMPWITSANIACGFHAGDTNLMSETVKLCKANNVAVGAHPSFPDRENFGRTNMNIPADQLRALVIEQVLLLQSIAMAQGVRLHHVKPHGALYNMAAADAAMAAVLAEAVASVDKGLVFYGLSGSHLITAAQAQGLRTANEVFADRTYQADGSLTPRSKPGALVSSQETTVARAMAFARGEPVAATDGTLLSLKADTICLHGDGADAIGFARAIHQRLRTEHVELRHE